MLIKLCHSNAVSTEGLGRDMILAGQRSLCVYPLKETEIQWRGESSESQWQWCIPGLEHSLAGPDVCFRGIPGIKFKNLKRLFKKQFKLNISGWKKKLIIPTTLTTALAAPSRSSTIPEDCVSSQSPVHPWGIPAGSSAAQDCGTERTRVTRLGTWSRCWPIKPHSLPLRYALPQRGCRICLGSCHCVSGARFGLGHKERVGPTPVRVIFTTPRKKVQCCTYSFCYSLVGKRKYGLGLLN